jgi:hypothetical protein
MKINKIILVLVICLTMLTIGSAIAAPNFALLYSNKNVSCYLDPDTVTYDGTILNCWLKLEIDDKPYVVNYLFNSKTKQMKAIKQRTYDNNENLTKEEPITQSWEPIDEENMIIYNKVMEYVKK